MDGRSVNAKSSSPYGLFQRVGLAGDERTLVRKLAPAPKIEGNPAVLFRGLLVRRNEDPRLKADEI
jgi:hypothetical protein